MSVVIPSSIMPAYTLPNLLDLSIRLEIGKSVKDFSSPAETQMGKAHDIAIGQAKLKYDADLNQYKTDFEAASLKADKASKIIGHAQNKKIKAITSLVINVLLVVSVAIAAAATGTWPIVFTAIPLLAGVVYTSYYTDIHRRMTNKLESDIAAPSKLAKPELSLPVYKKEKDLELAESRVNAQNNLATMSLEQAVKSSWSTDEIVKYDLLGRVVKLKENRHTLYSKFIQLGRTYWTIEKERSGFLGKAEQEYSSMEQQLHNWKRKEDSNMERQWSFIRTQERSQDRRIDRSINHGKVPVVPILGSIVTAISRSELEAQERDVNATYYRIDAQVKQWYQTNLAVINAAYNQALANIESQYTGVKSAAAAV